MFPSLLEPRLLCFLSPLVFLIINIITCSASDDQLRFVYHECNNNLGNFTSGSTYNTIRDAALTNLEIPSGFYYYSSDPNPEDSEKVNVIVLCRGDITLNVCRSCLQKSASLLTERCLNQKEAIGWYDQCMLRYSNRSILGQMETFPQDVLCSPHNITSTSILGGFSQVVEDLLNRLGNRTVLSGDTLLKFAEGSATVSKSSNETVHALLQCTPDLSTQDCTQCLIQAVSKIHEFCDRRKGARYIGPSCNVRYENYSFFDPIVDQRHVSPAPAPHPKEASPPPLPASAILTPSSAKGKRNTSRTVVAIVVPVVAVVLLLILIVIFSRLKKPRDQYIASNGEGEVKSEGEVDVEADDDLKTTELMQFDFETIKVATDNFSDANTLGQGGFGIVYKGLLSNGQQVAVKRLSHNSAGQGITEFKNEVLLTGKLQHRNLVRLLGFCLERKERLLVYEFVPNKSLDYIIFDPTKRTNLNWEDRFKIIKGIGRGLLYLHEDSRLQIVHRDLKTSNILLDEELNPKISDFGIARLFNANQTEGTTMNVIGTFGYMAPEYIKHGQFSVKSDVFSFGVMILEIICGQKNKEIRDGDNVEDLLSFAWKNWTEGTAANIIDPTLNHGLRNEIMRCIHIGLLCVQEDIDSRPTMNFVVLMLNSSSYPRVEPSEPPFLKRTRRLSSIALSEQYSEVTKSSDSHGTTSKVSSSDQYSEVTKSSDSGSQPTQGATSKTHV